MHKFGDSGKADREFFDSSMRFLDIFERCNFKILRGVATEIYNPNLSIFAVS
jgi:hypothetical protein